MNTYNKQEPIKTLSTPHYLNLGEMTEILKSNLRLLDGDLPKIWEGTLKINELHPDRTLNQLADILREMNPCGYNSSLLPILYTNRLKRVLASALLGMNNTKL